jgi:hypothetical protein
MYFHSISRNLSHGRSPGNLRFLQGSREEHDCGLAEMQFKHDKILKEKLEEHEVATEKINKTWEQK